MSFTGSALDYCRPAALFSPLVSAGLFGLLLAVTIQPAVSGSAPGIESAALSEGRDPLGDAVRAAVGRVDKSIVRLLPIGTLQAAGSELTAGAASTGLVISKDGDILTSTFALHGSPNAVVVETIDGHRASAKIVAKDFVRQLVLLKAEEAEWVPAEGQPRTAAKIGQWAVAAGRFYTAGQSNVAVGIISARDRIHGLAIQADAKISPVNYGGPLIDLAGGIHGIIVPLSPRGAGDLTAGVEWYDSGVGFAIPIEDALHAAERLKAGTDLKPGLLGISLVNTQPFSSEVTVKEVQLEGPAEKVGILPGDRLKSVDGIPINRLSVIESAVARSYAGDSLQIELERNGQPVSVTVSLTDRIPLPVQGYIGLLPLPVATMGSAGETVDDGKQPESPQKTEPAKTETPPENAAEAEVIVVVLEGSPAQQAGLPGRVRLLKVNDEPVNDVSALITAASRISPAESVQLTWKAMDSDETKTTAIITGEYPRVLPQLTETNRLDYLGLTAAAEPVAPAVQRSEVAIDDLGRIVIFYTVNDVTPPQPSGMILLLSESGVSEDVLLRQWKDVAGTHNLILAIPSNSDNSRLTEEDLPLVAAGIGRVVVDRPVDRQRLTVVADMAESSLARQLILAGRSPIRGLVMRSGWISPTETGSLSGSRRSILLLDTGKDLQSQSLANQAKQQLEEKGLRVFAGSQDRQESVTDPQSEVSVIADWSLIIKAL